MLTFENFKLDHAKKIVSSGKNVIKSYVYPGLNSYLIQETDEYKLRLFHQTRNEDEYYITPHSHRFNIRCKVLSRYVRNTIFSESIDLDKVPASLIPTNYKDYKEDEFMLCEQKYDSIGNYEFTEKEVVTLRRVENEYYKDDVYGMTSDEIHSIRFSKDSFVLFEESPIDTDISIVLLPFIDGKVCNTLKTEDWMFK